MSFQYINLFCSFSIPWPIFISLLPETHKGFMTNAFKYRCHSYFMVQHMITLFEVFFTLVVWRNVIKQNTSTHNTKFVTFYFIIKHRLPYFTSHIKSILAEFSFVCMLYFVKLVCWHSEHNQNLIKTYNCSSKI